MNDAVRLAFYPMGGFLNPDDNKTVMCLPFGEDRQCRSDKYEACVLQVHCGGVACDGAMQLQLLNFTSCFEGPKVPFDRADACAAGAGFDAAQIRACYDDDTARETAFDMVQAAVQTAESPPMGLSASFPWIVIDGTVQDVGDNASAFPLLQRICDVAEAQAIELKACTMAANAFV